MVMQTSAIDDVHRTLAAIRATPVLWIGSESFESLTVFGFYKEFSIDLAYVLNSGMIWSCSAGHQEHIQFLPTGEHHARD